MNSGSVLAGKFGETTSTHGVLMTPAIGVVSPRKLNVRLL
jgi:hypothetical protein